MWFPVAVFAVWRVAQGAVLWWHGGRLIEAAYTYDGAHYLRILHHGYWHPRPVMPSHAFFPGIAWLATPLRWITGTDSITVHLVATATALVAFVAVWGATREWTDERTARLAVVLLALFPSSLFLWAFYSEALFIALGAGAVWADRRGRHGIAAVCLAGIATTRSVGIIVPLVLVLARIIRQRRIDRWAVTYTASALAGLGAVLVAMQVQVGSAFAFLGVQDDWGRTVSWPWASVLQGVDNLTPDRRTVMIPALVARNFDLWSVAIVVVGIAVLVLSRRPRFPMEAWMLGVAMIALPLASSVLASFNRFALADWVIYPAYASLLVRLPPWWRRGVMLVLTVVCVATAYALLGRFAAARFIG
ncbi:MAG TPA: mannosyltransferase family protein [Acidimicrobiales bacterium]